MAKNYQTILPKMGCTNVHIIPCTVETRAKFRQDDGKDAELKVVMWLGFTDKDGKFNIAGITTHNLEEGIGTAEADPGFNGYRFLK